MPKARGSDPEEPPCVQGWGGREVLPCIRGQGRRPGGANPGGVAAQAQEGLEELFHIEGQERGR